MRRNKAKITQEEYDKAIACAYKLGYETGKIESHNQQWTSRGNGLTLVEKQVIAILERNRF